MSIGARIRDLRWDLRLNQGELAHRAGIAQNTLSQIELEKTTPSVPTLEKIAHGLGVDLRKILLEEPVAAGKVEAPQEGSGQPETAPPAEEEPTVVPQSAGTLKADVDRIRRLKGQHESDLEKIRRGELDYDAVLRMEAVDEGVRADLEKRGVLRFVEAVREHRELADDESVPLALLRELRYLEGLTDEARALSARVTSDIHEEVEKGASQAESWVSERHEQSS